MAEPLRELDEVIEKVRGIPRLGGKGMIPKGQGPKRRAAFNAQDNKVYFGSRAFRTRNWPFSPSAKYSARREQFARVESRLWRAHDAKRNAGRVKKSADPLTDLYTAIEKARGLLPRGGSRMNAFAAHRQAGRAKGKAREHWVDAFNDGSRGSYSVRVPRETRMATQRKLNEGASRKKKLANYLSSRTRRGVRKHAATKIHFTIDRTKVEKNDITGRYAAGFASVIEKDGKRVTDTQDDVIFWADLQETAHDFIKNERVAKVMHDGEMVGEVVESVLIDDDFAKALGLTDPRRGWFIKMDIADPDTRELNKAGKFGGFSIGGSGQRVDLTE